MKINNRHFLKIISVIILFMPYVGFSQTNDVEMADTFRSEGKIYVVIAVIGVILLGLILYLVFIDRKVTKMEKKMKDKN